MEGFLLSLNIALFYPIYGMNPPYAVILSPSLRETTPNSCDPSRSSHLRNSRYKLHQCKFQLFSVAILLSGFPNETFLVPKPSLLYIFKTA